MKKKAKRLSRKVVISFFAFFWVAGPVFARFFGGGKNAAAAATRRRACELDGCARRRCSRAGPGQDDLAVNISAPPRKQPSEAATEAARTESIELSNASNRAPCCRQPWRSSSCCSPWQPWAAGSASRCATRRTRRGAGPRTSTGCRRRRPTRRCGGHRSSSSRCCATSGWRRRSSTSCRPRGAASATGICARRRRASSPSRCSATRSAATFCGRSTATWTRGCPSGGPTA